MAAALEKCKITLIGSSNVGKTSIINTYVRHLFTNTTPTCGACYTQKVIRLDGKLLQLNIWDTAGAEKFRSVSSMYYRSTAVFLLCFDLADEQSVSDISYWLEGIRRVCDDSSYDVLLVANKSDCVSPQSPQALQAIEKAQTLGLKLLFCSAKQNVGVQEVFVEAARAARERRLRGAESTPSGSCLSSSTSSGSSAEPEPRQAARKCCE